jgi:hypothetical protein
MEHAINDVLLGATAMASALAGLLFLRFWMRTRDRLFVIFAIAFWLMSINWVCVALVRRDEATVAPLYILRLLAFLLILVGIIDKNRSRQPD